MSATRPEATPESDEALGTPSSGGSHANPSVPYGGLAYTYAPVPVPGPYGFSPVPQTSGSAIAVLVLGITSLVFLPSCGIGVFPAVIALAMAPGARREIAASGGTITGTGLVQAGVALSWVTLGAVIAVVVLFTGLGFLPALLVPLFAGS